MKNDFLKNLKSTSKRNCTSTGALLSSIFQLHHKKQKLKYQSKDFSYRTYSVKKVKLIKIPLK
jgi:hypothetical protein